MVLHTHAFSTPATSGISPIDLGTWASRYPHLHVDFGTGDGRFAVHLAREHPDLGVLGIDTCVDHLRGSPRRLPANVRFAQGDARSASLGVESPARLAPSCPSTRTGPRSTSHRSRR